MIITEDMWVTLCKSLYVNHFMWFTLYVSLFTNDFNRGEFYSNFVRHFLYSLLVNYFSVSHYQSLNFYQHYITFSVSCIKSKFIHDNHVMENKFKHTHTQKYFRLLASFSFFNTNIMANHSLLITSIVTLCHWILKRS